jgi:DNA-directed RNA polymerase subunit RPC12/RpoP
MGEGKAHPVCNHCEYEFDDDETWHREIHTGNGDTTEMECPSCGEKIFIYCEYDPKFYVGDEYKDVI